MCDVIHNGIEVQLSVRTERASATREDNPYGGCTRLEEVRRFPGTFHEIALITGLERGCTTNRDGRDARGEIALTDEAETNAELR